MRLATRILAPLGALLVVGLAGTARGCTSTRPPIHLNPNMDRQPKALAQSASGFFRDGKTMRAPVAGTVARGELPGDEGFERGKSFWTGYVGSVPLAVDDALLARGWERFQIYCSPCHGAAADGVSPMTEKAKLKTANLLLPSFRDVPPGRLFEVISDGKGLMPGYRFPIPAHDRWAIVAWIEQLQEQAAEIER